jgi:dienelactone hydrolase
MREDLRMAMAQYGRALAAALLLLMGCAQTIAIPDQRIGVSRVPDKPLSASLVLPDGPGPFPVVILLHGCGGIGGGDWYWARRLTDWGYAALVLDSFSARGVTTVCAPQAQHLVTPQDRVADVLSAALYLRTLPKIDGARIGVLGRSHGGHTAALVTQDRYARLYPGLIEAVVDYYGSCDVPELHGNVPLLALAGEADDWGHPALSCHVLGGKVKPDQPFEIHTYPGVWHAFDNPDQRTVQVSGHTLAYDAGAADDSIGRVHVFLDTWLRRKPAAG